MSSLPWMEIVLEVLVFAVDIGLSGGDMTDRSGLTLTAAAIVVVAIVAFRLAVIAGYVGCSHRCPWCFAKLQEVHP